MAGKRLRFFGDRRVITGGLVGKSSIDGVTGSGVAGPCCGGADSMDGIERAANDSVFLAFLIGVGVIGIERAASGSVVLVG